MRVAAMVVGAGTRGRAILSKTEAGTVTGITSTEETRGYVLTNTGSISGQARSDRARSIGGSDIEAEGVIQLKSGVAEAAGRTYGRAYRQRQEAC